MDSAFRRDSCALQQQPAEGTRVSKWFFCFAFFAFCACFSKKLLVQAAASAVGKKIAEVCAAAGITKVCFDRAGYKYHGRVLVRRSHSISTGLCAACH